MTRQERIDHLRRRVLEDPASIAFAQLAEEYRRCGDCQAAVDTCRSGLVAHPDYLSARVTLGRALLALDRFEEAAHELGDVLAMEPENVGALRGMGEFHQRCGNRARSLDCFSRALALAPYDADLERAVSQLTRDPLGGAATAAAGSPEIEGDGPDAGSGRHVGETPRSGLGPRGEEGEADVLVPTAVARSAGPSSGMTDEERVAPLIRTATTIAALEEWLSAIYVARTNRSA